MNMMIILDTIPLVRQMLQQQLQLSRRLDCCQQAMANGQLQHSEHCSSVHIFESPLFARIWDFCHFEMEMYLNIIFVVAVGSTRNEAIGN